MNQLQRKALASLPLSKETVESFYDGSRSGTAEECLKALCVSHEGLRAEVKGAEALLFEEPGKAALRSLLTAYKEAVAVLLSLNDHERVCRELIAAKVDDGDDLGIILTNVMLRLDNTAFEVETSLSPKRMGSEFETWLRETFLHRDKQTHEGNETELKMEAVPHAHVFDYEQAIRLATFIWEQMEGKRPPWWSKYRTAEKAQKALALTDTGSDAFREAFPEGKETPGWRVVERIREVLRGECA